MPATGYGACSPDDADATLIRCRLGGIREALQAYVDEMRSLGRALPEPVHAVGTVHA
jgi:hypothetical protein